MDIGLVFDDSENNSSKSFEETDNKVEHSPERSPGNAAEVLPQASDPLPTPTSSHSTPRVSSQMSVSSSPSFSSHSPGGSRVELSASGRGRLSTSDSLAKLQTTTGSAVKKGPPPSSLAKSAKGQKDDRVRVSVALGSSGSLGGGSPSGSPVLPARRGTLGARNRMGSLVAPREQLGVSFPPPPPPIDDPPPDFPEDLASMAPTAGGARAVGGAPAGGAIQEAAGDATSPPSPGAGSADGGGDGAATEEGGSGGDGEGGESVVRVTRSTAGGLKPSDALKVKRDSVRLLPSLPVEDFGGRKVCDHCRQNPVQSRLRDGFDETWLCQPCLAKRMAERDMAIAPSNSGVETQRRFGKRRMSLTRRNTMAKVKETGKEHELTEGVIRHARWCSVCGKFLWQAAGARVQLCGHVECKFIAHHACRENAVQKTCPQRHITRTDGYRGEVFGAPIAATTEVRRNQIPICVEDAVEFLLETGLKEEGLLRMSGSHAEIQRLKKEYDKGDEVVFRSDPHTVAGMLKLYFRELPEPVVPERVNDSILGKLDKFKLTNDAAVGDISYEQAIELARLLKSLPPPNFETLKYLTYFLIRLQEHAAENQMSLNNIMICIMPSVRCAPGIIMHGIKHFDLIYGDSMSVSAEGLGDAAAATTTDTTDDQ